MTLKQFCNTQCPNHFTKCTYTSKWNCGGTMEQYLYFKDLVWQTEKEFENFYNCPHILKMKLIIKLEKI